MNKLNKLDTAFWSKRFFIAAILVSLFGLAGNLTAVNGQGFYLKFIQVRVFNGLDKNGSITSEKYNENGGSVDINVQGNAKYVCPGGSEKMRFVWTFGRNVSQVVPATGVSATLEAGQVNISPPCSTGLSGNSDFSIGGSSGATNPFTTVESRKTDGELFFQPFEERNRIFPYTADGSRKSAVIGVRVRDRADPESQFAWFELFISTNAGNVEYVYLYEIVRGGEVTYAKIAGAWESDYSGSWKPASIRQEGSRLWFTNEFGDTSEGIFESSSRVKATKWNVGATIQSNTIKWDNGTTWRRGMTYETDKPGSGNFGALLDNITFQGDILTYYGGTTAAQCQSDCAAKGNCQAFTFVRANAYKQGDPVMCYLITRVTNELSNSCCISGKKR